MLIAFVAFVLVLQANPSVPQPERPRENHKTTTENQNSTAQKQQDSSSQDRVLPPTYNVTNRNEQQTDTDKIEERRDRKAQLRADRISFYITGVGVFGAWVGLGLLIWQNILTRRAANAAQLNAQAVINSERPWIIVRPSESKDGGIKFDAKNIGRTPAKIISCSYDVSYQRSVEEMPKLPRYEKFVEDWISWLAAGDSYPVLKQGFSRETFYDENSEGFATKGNRAIFWGCITYRDPIQPSISHETRFCYSCASEDSSPIISGGPEGYIENT
jgi:hypothetical protein